MNSKNASRTTKRAVLIFRMVADVLTLLVKTVPVPYHLLVSVITSTSVCVQDIYQDFKDGWNAV